MNDRALLRLTAVIEAATGLALIIHPALVVGLLLGGDISGAGLALGRVAGFGLLSLGVACWPLTEASLPALRGMLTYNVLAAVFFATLWLSGQLVGKLLPPVALLHAVLALLLARAWLRSSRMAPRSST